METLEQQGVRLLAAMKDDATPIDQANLRDGCAFLIGNEGAGLAEAWAAMAEERVTIPCPGWVESLNAAVAGSLLLYEASRQRKKADSSAALRNGKHRLQNDRDALRNDK